ncbi:MAG: hypothetical protein VKM97_00080 [Cyanobacteriota bacterium]|nr:hypothetical protein [Cyanobacteriota bacterium]
MRASVVARLSLALAWLAALAAAPALAGPNGAPDPRGFYATLGIGASWPQSSTVRDTVLGMPASTTVVYDGSFAAEAGLGYDFGAVRTELTAVYNRASITGASGGNTATGNRNATSIFASAFLDIPTRSRWVPYLGGGIGYTTLGSGTVTASSGGSSVVVNTGNLGVFGYQAKAGVAFIASDSTDVFLEAVFQGAPGTSSGSTSTGPFSSWGARVGFRLRFGGEPVPTPLGESPAPGVSEPSQAPPASAEPALEPIRGPW